MIRPGQTQPGHGLDEHDQESFSAFSLGAWPKAEFEITMDEERVLRVIKHLLPRSTTWKLSPDKQHTQFLEALTVVPAEHLNYLDLIFKDMFPADTRQLTEWEAQFGLDRNASLPEASRRNALDAAWKSVGGQSPSYIQNLLRDAGFDVYVHEWWEYSGSVRVTRDPRTYIAAGGITYTTVYGNASAQYGNTDATQYGTKASAAGTLLVNKIKETKGVPLSAGMYGSLTAQYGKVDTLYGISSGTVSEDKVYTIPSDPDLWTRFWYVGGAVFPASAAVENIRKDEFETLILKVKPVDTWVGLLINYV